MFLRYSRTKPKIQTTINAHRTADLSFLLLSSSQTSMHCRFHSSGLVIRGKCQLLLQLIAAPYFCLRVQEWLNRVEQIQINQCVNSLLMGMIQMSRSVSNIILVTNLMPYLRHISKHENPTNCGTKAADVLANFLPANFNANPLNILLHLQLL